MASIEEALKAKANAETKYAERDFLGAKNYALKAQMLCPHLVGISQMVAAFGVHSAAATKVNGEFDFYAILGSDPSSNRAMLKKQYKKLAVLLNPDKNKRFGADAAFRLVSEAWRVLSDGAKRSSYDRRRSLFTVHASGVGNVGNYSNFSPSHNRLDTFWTVCTSCQVQYEYHRKYVNKRLSCKNCYGVFIAVETGLAAVSGAYPNSNWRCSRENGYGSHGRNVAYVPIMSIYSASNGVSEHRSGHGSENMVADVVLNGYSVCNEQPFSRRGRPSKKRKLLVESTYCYNGEVALATATEITSADGNKNGNMKQDAKLPTPSETSIRRCLTAPAFDVRQLLIDKTRTYIRKKLEQIRSAAETGSLTITVPDSDFHDFDKDRSEDCFKPKQIWALYNEEDGMPRLYCLIREVISVNPFKIHISYLSSKSDSEFGLVNWLDSGFTKSCGNFRVLNSEIIEQVNIFSHLLSGKKAGRGGCVRIYPKSGDIWAVYRNWSPDWNRTTPEEVRCRYEMVEILDDYSEELGVSVAPLVKLDGFKTVYRRKMDKDSLRRIPRREMLRFSHQVPSCLLKRDGVNLPEGCWDLDPAATPEDLLHGVNEVKQGPSLAESYDLNETSLAETKTLVREKLEKTEYVGIPDKFTGATCDL
ncbi:PREDICTED: uncharacterized protein LOC109226975 [Nicotiana attenuata]|uniref:Chaperone protein dnaj a6, chloroplastic n=1 Tax=Nicotiana attenuata TaxID=49451 RepID=A0A1J6ICA2_NICAT|nr:PREDICTED: uncharacterized protein LOC109226975 [Nicotiana attenuata]OIT02202.1 chaperone protein dnaj a6, chloroplastic [Nicotiana attenuata]